MKAWQVASVGFLVAFAAGCSSGPSSPEMSLRGTYQAVSDGPYAQMTFLDGEHYTLQKSHCSSECTESGTYAVNGLGTVMALRDAKTGQVTEMPFSALASAPTAPTLLSGRVRTLGTPLTTGSPGSLASGTGSLASGSGSLTTGSGSLTSGSGQPLVSDGGALTFGNGSSLMSDGGSPMPGFNAGMQPFSLGDAGGSGDSGGNPFATSADSGGGGVPDGGIYPCTNNACPNGGTCHNGWCFIPGVSCNGPTCM